VSETETDEFPRRRAKVRIMSAIAKMNISTISRSAIQETQRMGERLEQKHCLYRQSAYGPSAQHGNEDHERKLSKSKDEEKKRYISLSPSRAKRT
jgi:hypothetical protein